MRGINHRPAPPALSLLPDGPGSSVLGAGILAGSFGETLTFSRSGAKVVETGTGAAALVASGAPAVGSQGLLVEQAHTNTLVHSDDLTAGDWQVQGSPTVTKNAAIAPDGTMTAALYICGSQNALARIYQAPAGSSPSAASVWIKRISTSGIFSIESANGPVHGQLLVDFSLLGDGWNHITAAHPAVQSGSTPAFDGSILFQATVATGTLSMYLWQPQMETGGFAHSIVPTTSAAVTVAKDVASLPGGSVPLAAGEVSLEFTPLWGTPPGICALFDCRDPGSDSGLLAYVNGTDSVVWRVSNNGTTPSCQFLSPTWVQGQTYRLRFAWSARETAIYRDGELVASGDGIAPTHVFNDSFFVGSDYTGGNTLDGYISNLKVRAL